MSYKIRIPCTSKNEFCFDNKPITKNITDEIYAALRFRNMEYADSASILFKHSKRKGKEDYITTKNIEFFCDKLLQEKDIRKFIKKLKKCKFSSIHDSRVEFIDTRTNDVLNKIRFTTGESATIEPRGQKQKNQSKYFVHKLKQTS